MNKIKTNLTQNLLHELLEYDPSTGEFLWKHRNINWFNTENDFKAWNNRLSGKKAGYVDKRGYLFIRINYFLYSAHRLAWLYVYGSFPKMIDHINGNRQDNRIENLRECTDSQNQGNSKRSKNNTTGYKGVSLHKGTGKYTAEITYNNKKIYLGLFLTPEEAHDTYCKKASELFEEFCNFG
jgi:hypothetical protein